MNLNDRYLYEELLAVIAESEERRLTSETVDILHGHPEFTMAGMGECTKPTDTNKAGGTNPLLPATRKEK